MGSEGLRLVVYDATGHGGSWFQPYLTASWRVGVGLYAHYPHAQRVDASFGARSWQEAFAWLASVQPRARVREVQYWGHGLPGRVLIARDTLDADTLANEHKDDVAAVRARLSDDALIWLRTCSAFAGARGHAYARALADAFGCRVAGHTFVIGPLQSGLRTLRPAETPSWSTTEGLDGERLRPSSPIAPRTITCLQGSVPHDW